MEFKEMNQRAYRREAPPDDLTPAERMIYMALCLMYELHFAGRYTRAEGGSAQAPAGTGLCAVPETGN